MFLLTVTYVKNVLKFLWNFQHNGGNLNVLAKISIWHAQIPSTYAYV